VSPSAIAARSIACTDVIKPQPPPMYASGGTLSGSFATTTPGSM